MRRRLTVDVDNAIDKSSVRARSAALLARGLFRQRERASIRHQPESLRYDLSKVY